MVEAVGETQRRCCRSGLTSALDGAVACGTPSACPRPGAVGSRAGQLAHQVLKSLISSLSRAEIRAGIKAMVKAATDSDSAGTGI